MNVNDAAQTVQRSGCPTAYAPHEQAARTLVATVSGATRTPRSTPEPTSAQGPRGHQCMSGYLDATARACPRP
jgi:hypothetical protein